jgi:hypothetical protein
MYAIQRTDTGQYFQSGVYGHPCVWVDDVAGARKFSDFEYLNGMGETEGVERLATEDSTVPAEMVKL